MFKKICLTAVIALAVVGCQSTQLSTGASKVLVSPNNPPHGCKYVGEITGNQGNFFTGSFTSNKNLEQGAMNDVKNQAVALGANYVQMVTNRAGASGGAFGTYGGGGGAGQQTNVTYTGNAYKCPKLDT